MNENENKKNTGGYYSALTGWRRAVPIILAALAVFVAVCFITDSTGALGGGVSDLLLGSFSYGAYFIPLLLILHAIFYAQDVAKRRTISRIIFSVITVIFISSIEYTFVFFNDELLFTPVEFFKEQKAGGFIGCVVAFALVKMLGSIGVLILAITLFAIYITFFFAGSNSAIGKFFITVLGTLAGALASAERGIKKLFGTAKQARHSKEKKESDKKNAELLDDQFFTADGSMSELTIKELGIHEKGIGDIQNAELQSSVFHKSAVKEEPVERLPQQDTTLQFGDRKSVNLNFDIPDDTPVFDNTVNPPETKKREFYGIDECAEDVFTKDFDPFDFIAAEKIAAKASSKAQKPEEDFGIGEMARPISSLTAEQFEKERRQAEFELRKKQLLEMHGKEQVQDTRADEPIPAASSKEAARDTVKTVEFKVTNEPSLIRTAPLEGSSLKKTYEKHEHNEEETRRAAAHIAEVVAMNNPAYTRSSNEYTYTQVRYTDNSEETSVYEQTDADDKNDIYEESVSTPVINEYSTASVREEVAEEEFKAYETPVEDTPAEIRTDEPEQVLKIERTILSPTPTPIEKAMEERDSRYTVITDDMPISEEADSSDEEEADEGFVWSTEESDTSRTPISESGDTEGTVFSFGDDEEDDEEENGDIYAELPEDEAIITEEIPPEEQNPEVIRQREMFPFLDRDEENKEDYSEENAREDGDDEAETVTEDIGDGNYNDADDTPPFELDAPVVTEQSPLAGLVAVEDTKKSKENKNKKPDYSNYVFPSIELLGKDEPVTGEDINVEIQENADKLIETLASFNVTASIKGVDRGPRITRYEVVPAKGVKVSNVMNLQDNIALELAANEIRMEAPIPGKSAIGIEIPNKRASTVRLRDLLETEDFRSFKSKTAICIGRDVAGQPVFGDIATMPHLLIAGATGMGKSVCINALMISMLYKARPDEVKFIMIDPKQVEFTMYNGIPHLLVPVVSDAKQAAGVLMWAVEEMERRYGLLNPLCVRNVDAYNDKVSKDPTLGEPLSRIVIVIDEFADLMLQVRDPVENLVMRIAQKARAAGIHLIIGTQRPTANVITGTIKANIPSRISCKVASNVDSRTVLDASGAEKLLNKGDMLYAFAGAIKPLRVQGAFVSDGEVESIMEHLKSFSDGNSYDSNVMEEIERAAQKCSKKGSGSDYDDDGDESSGEGYLNDRQFLDAVEVAVNTGKISTSLIQRKLSIGYGKAAKFIDIMEEMGIVGEPNGQRPREVNITPDEWREKLARLSYD